MKKLYAIVFMAMLALTGKAFAEMSYGVSAALTKIDASGTETEGGEKTMEVLITQLSYLQYLLSTLSQTQSQQVQITFQ